MKTTGKGEIDESEWSVCVWFRLDYLGLKGKGVMKVSIMLILTLTKYTVDWKYNYDCFL